ncbi:9615_t:CDS:1, partial [Scutellospora calospora]
DSWSDFQQNDSSTHIGRRFSSPPGPSTTSANTSRRSRRTFSLLPSSSTRTLSIANYLHTKHAQSKCIENDIKSLNIEIPLIITTKSDTSRQQVPSYCSVDEPPAYIYASMIPPPPEYCSDTYDVDLE